MKIYLDNCCFNRPFDDQMQLRIMLEAEAKLRVQSDVLRGKFDLVWSYMLEAENNANPFGERREAIKAWKQYSCVIITQNETILQRASDLIPIGVKSKDALHIACAIAAESTYFLTTDDKLLNKNALVEELIVTDPIGFIREVYP